MWNETYDALSNYDKGEFRRLANYMLSHTYLVRDQYQPDKQWMETNHDYRTMGRLFDCMREYFSISGWRLERDEQYGVIALINEFEHNRFRIDRFTTLFLYTCRLIYEEGREQGDNQRIVRTDTATIVEKMRFLGLLDRGRTTQKERLDAQRTLAHFNILQKMESAAWNPEGNGLLILPSILSIITNQGINDMIMELEDMRSDDPDATPDEESRTAPEEESSAAPDEEDNDGTEEDDGAEDNDGADEEDNDSAEETGEQR